MREQIKEMTQDEQGCYSSVRGYGLGTLVPLVLMVIVGIVFAVFQNQVGIDYVKWVILALVVGGSSTLMAGQFKSAVALREEYRQRSDESASPHQKAEGKSVLVVGESFLGEGRR